MQNAARLALAIGIVFASPGVVHAKDLCFSTSQDGTFFRFTKAKLPKKAGVSAPLVGAFVAGTLAAPLTGAATRRADGSLVIGIHVHSLTPLIGNDFVSTMIADANLAASGNHRDVGPTTAPNTWTWLPVDCKLVPVP